MFLTRMNSDRKLAALDSGEEGVIYVSRLQLAVEQILFARNYTIRLLDQTPVTEWFRQPPDGVSHIAWQVGHLAFAGEQSTCECDQFAPVGQPAAGHKKTIKRSLWLQRRTYVPGETKRG